LAISGAALNALRVTRTGALSNWKGLAYPFTAFSALSASFLAMRGITGPLEVFEGNKGFQQSIAGEFQIDWGKEDLERVNHTILKKFNAEIHSQSLLEGALDIIRAHSFNSQDIERIEVLTFDVAYKIIGGGEEGNKKIIRTKEEADHSIPYMLAVAFLDGNVMPDQYLQERIQARDVQELLQKVEVKVSEQYSKQFPGKMLGRLTVLLKDGRFLEVEKSDYHGFLTRPMDWETVSQKFENLTGNFAGRGLRSQITDMVYDLEMHTISDLTKLLAFVGSQQGGGSSE
jgi:2-methylcitrate dehydratase